MHHHNPSAVGRAISAILLGERLALFLASLSLLLIFWNIARRYFLSLALRRPVNFADQLGAGIWMVAAGMVLSDLVRIALTTVWRGMWNGYPVAAGMMALGVLTILVGYVMHILSFIGEVHPALRKMSLYWTLGIALACAGAVTWALA